jgi:competence protein ComEA
MMANVKRIIVLLTVVGFILGFSGNVLAADAKEKININTATAETLTQLKGVGEKLANSIVQFRKENGPFKSVADLELVKGIGPKILADNADMLTI